MGYAKLDVAVYGDFRDNVVCLRGGDERLTSVDPGRIEIYRDKL